MSRVSHTTTTAQCDVQNEPLGLCDANVANKKSCAIVTSMASVYDDGTMFKMTEKDVLLKDVSTATHVPDFNVLCYDELQHILSFDCVYRTKSVCKTWHKLSNRNERIKLLKLCDEAQKMSPLQFSDQANQTWIVHPARKILNATERELGYQGPVSCILDAIDECKSGDRILVHDGVYNFYHLEIQENVEIIGIGPNVIVEGEDDDGLDEDEPDSLVTILIDVIPRWQGGVFFMNLTIDCSRSAKSLEIPRISIGWGNSFSAHKCKFAFASIGIEVFREARLKVTNCEFDDATTAIHISRLAAEVTVNGSTFRHCGLEPDDEGSLANGEHSCIAIDSWTQEVHVSLNCDRNTFKDNLCYPIAETACFDSDTGTVKPRLNLKHSLTNNWLKGYNATQTRAKGVLKDANTLYFNDDLAFQQLA